ncbi:MAG: serine protease [Candidatus Melainabacteria bacterium]|nr:serine protease [Candidatus Melainabacteria bacterium]
MSTEFSAQQIRYELSRITGNPLGSPGIGRLVNYYLKDTDKSGGISLEEFKNATDQYSRLGNPNNISKKTFKIIEDDWLNLGKNVQLPIDKKFTQGFVGRGISSEDITPSNRPTIPPDLISLAQESTLPVFSGAKHQASLGIFKKQTLDNGKTIYFFITASHVVDGEESKNLQVKLTDGTEIPLNILESTGDYNKDRAIGYFVSDNSNLPAVPLSNEYAKAGDQVINTGYPAKIDQDTRAFEHFRTRADDIEYDQKRGVTQITDTTYLTEHSLDKNHRIGFNGEVISSDENRYLYKTNLSGLPGQSGSPLFRVTDDNNLEIIGIMHRAWVGKYDPQTENLIFSGDYKVPYDPQIELDKKNTKPIRVNLEFTTFASVNSKMNYPNLEKTIQDTINRENQNSK